MAGYPARYIWMNGEYVEWAEPKIHVHTAAVLTGANVFEGLRAYSNLDERQVYILRLQEHLARLWQSMKIMRMTPSVFAGRVDQGVHRYRSQERIP